MKSKSRDIAFWIGERMAFTGVVPTRQLIAAAFPMSRANAYRWHAWAKAKLQPEETHHEH